MRWGSIFDAGYPESPPMVRLALDILTEPCLNELSDNGRVNIFVYLASIMEPAWTPVLFQRWTPHWRTSIAATSKALRRLAPSRESGSMSRSGTLIDSGFGGLARSGAIMRKAPCLASQPGVARQNSVRALACKASIILSNSCRRNCLQPSLTPS